MLLNKKELVNKIIEEYKRDSIKIAQEIWLNPEVAFKEKFASKMISEYLKNKGFKITKVKDMPTAFIATFGTGKVNVGLLGEYDALPNIGHGCGHNLLGVGSMLAATTIAKIIKAKRLPLTISYFGCPAEESGAGKVQMVKNGLFDKIDYCLTWHPAAKNSITNDTWIGSQILFVEFNGKVGHSSIENINKNVNHIMVCFIQEIEKLKIPHFFYIINSSNQTLSLMPQNISLNLAIRSFEKKKIDYFVNKIKDIVKEKKFINFVKISMKEFYPITRQNLELMDIVNSNFVNFKDPSLFNSIDLKKGQEILKTISSQEQVVNMKSMNIPRSWKNKVLKDQILYSKKETLLSFPTDVGAISNVVPTVQFQTICMPLGVGMHTIESRDASNTSIGYKGMVYAAKILAGSVLDLI